MEQIDSGIELTCEDSDCDCSLIVEQSCSKPTGDYLCACGAPLRPVSALPEQAGMVGPGS